MLHHITASMLYNIVQCPKRVELDLFGDPSVRDEISPFIAMLWERGTRYEQQVIGSRGFDFLDLSDSEPDEAEDLTIAAMQAGEPLIYSGRITADGLLGVPDLLRRHGQGYHPIDIKSGGGEEAGGDDDDGKPKLHYAVQLALYVDILERMGLSSGRRGYIFDVHGREVEYDLTAPRGVRKVETLWDEYKSLLATAQDIAFGRLVPKGALASACKLCHWYTCCSGTLRGDNDLTLIPALGRAIRDSLEATFPTVADLAGCNPDGYITKGKTAFRGVGPDRLRTFHERAKMLSRPDATPYLKAPVALPRSRVEFFFDIEVDPLRDFTYLHGIVERRDGDTASERFIAFFADDESPAAERAAFAESFALLTSEPDATIWYYSKYERTIYRKLQARYPDVCSAEQIESLFDPNRAVDLYYDVVMKATEWPTNDHSIKTLAKHLGFAWRDNDPSGAASIEWFDQWVQTRDPAIKTRILEYNEDDCRATRVLLDGIRAL